MSGGAAGYGSYSPSSAVNAKAYACTRSFSYSMTSCAVFEVGNKEAARVLPPLAAPRRHFAALLSPRSSNCSPSPARGSRPARQRARLERRASSRALWRAGREPRAGEGLQLLLRGLRSAAKWRRGAARGGKTLAASLFPTSKTAHEVMEYEKLLVHAYAFAFTAELGE